MRKDSLLPDSDPVTQELGRAYEAPRVVPIGNLRDLLAGSGTKPCDGTFAQPGNDPATACD
jgi:hypothetical protein